MFGVSPAYFFSRYSTDFTVDNYINGLEWLKEHGFEGFQLEVFYKENLADWEKQASRLADASVQLGMRATQFVAHFLLYATKTPDALLSDAGIEEMKRLPEITAHFPGCTTITLPLSLFFLDSSYPTLDKTQYQHFWEAYCKKLLVMDKAARAGGMRLALEIVPGSLMGGTEGFIRFIQETGNQTIGYNFDTGHAYVSKECLELIPAKLAGRIYGTHLKDNAGLENFALPPGKGTIDWTRLLSGLEKNGYRGSLDLEIASKTPDLLFDEYLEGKAWIEKSMNQLDSIKNKA